ncbi:hypothetical protein F2Q68_00019550 [Brassica cretica]|uniref:Disease resistance protein Roq1-like winged-helix domain-containing protein n=1 Tax=Brassica cretica TaxID=69181 RepID=A0A8S9FQZ2_BRACR|nr:hypothetical protein F2Q68_00019550 [Brassica cretica]
MIEKIANDVSDKLNATPSNDFDGMVELEAHLEKLKSLLHLEKDGAMIAGISGPAGIVELCGNLPLDLRVVGSSLRGKNEDEWDVVVHRLETSLARDIERVLRVGYDSLHENDQILFLYIAIFFNYKDNDHVKTMLSSTHVDERHGLKTLVNKSLMDISSKGKVCTSCYNKWVDRRYIDKSLGNVKS